MSLCGAIFSFGREAFYQKIRNVPLELSPFFGNLDEWAKSICPSFSQSIRAAEKRTSGRVGSFREYFFFIVFHKTAIHSPVQAVEVVCPTSIDNGSMRLAEVAGKYLAA